MLVTAPVQQRGALGGGSRICITQNNTYLKARKSSLVSSCFTVQQTITTSIEGFGSCCQGFSRTLESKMQLWLCTQEQSERQRQRCIYIKTNLLVSHKKSYSIPPRNSLSVEAMATQFPQV